MKLVKRFSSKLVLNAILDRIDHIKQSGNSAYSSYQFNVIRGLIWAYTGEDPDCIYSVNEVSKLVGKKLIRRNGKWFFKSK